MARWVDILRDDDGHLRAVTYQSALDWKRASHHCNLVATTHPAMDGRLIWRNRNGGFATRTTEADAMLLAGFGLWPLE